MLGKHLDAKYAKYGSEILSSTAPSLREYGGTNIIDAATVMGQSLVASLLVLETGHPVCLALENCTSLYLEGGSKDGVYYAEISTESCKKYTDSASSGRSG